MSEFKATQWKYSDRSDKLPLPGRGHFEIIEARCDESAGYYSLRLRDLRNEAVTYQRYNLFNVDAAGNVSDNSYTKSTLLSLGRALAGKDIGYPNPTDVVGGVVIGDVICKPSNNGVTYANIYRYYPAAESMVVAFSKIDQYSLPDDDVITDDEVPEESEQE